MKICSFCKIEKPLNEFTKHSKRKDGLQPFCKICKSNLNAIDCKKRRKNNKEKAFQKLGNSCKRCGLTSNCFDVFDFHHVNSNEKEKSPSDLLMGSWKKLEKELDKCVLLCANCHRITHYEIRNFLTTDSSVLP